MLINLTVPIHYKAIRERCAFDGGGGRRVYIVYVCECLRCALCCHVVQNHARKLDG